MTNSTDTMDEQNTVKAEGKVLVVDDDLYLLRAIGQTLTLEGYNVELQGSSPAALKLIGKFAGSDQRDQSDQTGQDGLGQDGLEQGGLLLAVIADIRMPVLDGMELLQAVRKLDPDLPVIMITGHGDISLAVQAIRVGAYDFLEKPVDEEVLLASLQRAVEKRRLVTENRRLQAEISRRSSQSFFRGMVGCHPLMHRLYDVVERVAPENDPVLLCGETGTGKELVARAIHQIYSPKEPFVAVNMAALPAEIVESELFGHERGAFTGAVATKVGRFEFAGKGTLFLDEICSLPVQLQGKLLRVLEDRRFSRLGSNQTQALQARIISATNRDLLQEAEAGHFRRDLYYRLNVFTIEIPPLRDRREDIPLLVEFFRQEYCRERSEDVEPFSKTLLEKLCAMEWQGNIRELRNHVRRLCVFGDKDTESGEQSAYDESQPGDPGTCSDSGNQGLSGEAPEVNVSRTLQLREFIEEQEKAYIIDVLQRCEGKVVQAHQVLGLSRKGLYDKINRYGIDLESFRGGGDQSPEL